MLRGGIVRVVVDHGQVSGVGAIIVRAKTA